MRQKYRTSIFIGLTLLFQTVSAEPIQKNYTFSSGTPAKASEVNANFDALFDKINKLDQALTNANATINTLLSSAIPVGVIVMWSGQVTNVPTGWALCNGSGGTPDLRGKFIVGAGGTYSLGQTGGAERNDISHTHAINPDAPPTSVAGNHAHHVEGQTNACIGDCVDGADSGSKSVGSDTHQHSFSIGTSGAGDHSHTVNNHAHGGITQSSNTTTIDNRPPYYALAYIMKLR